MDDRGKSGPDMDALPALSPKLLLAGLRFFRDLLELGGRGVVLPSFSVCTLVFLPQVWRKPMVGNFGNLHFLDLPDHS